MQITLYTDYALRVLLYLAMSPDKQANITEIADFYNISRNHLVKIVHQLGSKGFVATTRGKGGGIALQRPPEQINIGDVVRSMEKHFNWVECFDPKQQNCRLLPGCGLKHLLAQAGNAYLQVLDATTLANVLLNTVNVGVQSKKPLVMLINDNSSPDQQAPSIAEAPLCATEEYLQQ